MKPAFSDDMLQALGDGVCQQLAAGTDREMIIANLRTVSLNGASEPMVTTGNGSAASTTLPSADQLAEVFVDAAEADYCR
ncbi:hypothetical protein GCM10020255_084640 [Rhodococcus baikonurensis]